MAKHRSRKNAALKKRIQRRSLLFPDLEDEVFPHDVGFCQTPRVVPLVANLINAAEARWNAGPLYQVLWARDWGPGLIEVDDPKNLAFEAGYVGPRAERNWSDRVRTLTELRMIKTRAKGNREHAWILLRDPYLVVAELKWDPPEGFGDRLDNQWWSTWWEYMVNFALDFGVDLGAYRDRVKESVDE